jgi:DNA-binding NarL/FixJ family response regulator
VTTIVTVDDHAPFLEAARAVVRCVPGFEIVGEQADARAALGVVRDADPDMVIVDVRMPGMDGIELARRLNDENPTRVVVLATTADLEDVAPRAQRCGAAALVNKRWLTPRLLRGLWVAHRRR